MGIVQAITSLAQLVLQIISGAKALASFIEANKNEAWFQDSAKTFADLRATVTNPALTKEEKSAKLKEAGLAIGYLLSHL